jgi:hypothetical protein
MNSSKAIGGYFELELRDGPFMHNDATLLNSGRNCLAYILEAQSISRIYIPKYTCDVLIEPLKRLNIDYSFYSIDQNLEIKENIDLSSDDLLLYTNYFGIKDSYSKELARRYQERLILDCAQAFFFKPPYSPHVFYSPRKFFGLPDGGMLYTNKRVARNLPTDHSYERFNHLLKRIDLGPEAAYEEFKQEDRSLDEQPVKQMSKLTQHLLKNIDFEAARKNRLENFKFLQEELKALNKLNINAEELTGPLAYPLFTEDLSLRDKLISHKIYVPLYWPNVMEWCKDGELEYHLAQGILPLPIDQRYGLSDMKKVIDVINA